MKRSFVATGCLAVIVAAPAFGNEPPPGQADPISLTRNSPSVVLFGNTPADIYGEVIGAGFGGWDVGGPGPVMHVPDMNYGLQPMADNNDAHSNGEQQFSDPGMELVIYFSGDVSSVGMPLTDYDHQAQRNQAAGDRFVSNGAAQPPSFVLSSGVPSPLINGPVFPGAFGTMSPNILSANQDRYNEIPTRPAMIYNSYLPPAGSGALNMDDMDALELMPFDTNGDLMHDTPVYFSLDPLSPSLGLGAGSPADILVSLPMSPAIQLFAPAPLMGLTMIDDVDALAVWDYANPLVADGQIDYALFSLAPGSPSLVGPDGAWGTADDYSAADIFVTDFSGVNALYMTAQTLGMQFMDNIDALDVEAWEGPQSVEVFEEIWELPAIEGDLDGDGFVGLDDLDIILRNWNQTVPPADPLADPNGDGYVGLDDLDIVLRNWNKGVPPPAADVPEPATVALFSLAGYALITRRAR